MQDPHLPQPAKLDPFPKLKNCGLNKDDDDDNDKKEHNVNNKEIPVQDMPIQDMSIQDMPIQPPPAKWK